MSRGSITCSYNIFDTYFFIYESTLEIMRLSRLFRVLGHGFDALSAQIFFQKETFRGHP